jgi:hypothetical protein
MMQYYNTHRLHKIYQWAGGCKLLLEGMQVNVIRGKKAKLQPLAVKIMAIYPSKHCNSLTQHCNTCQMT